MELVHLDCYNINRLSYLLSSTLSGLPLCNLAYSTELFYTNCERYLLNYLTSPLHEKLILNTMYKIMCVFTYTCSQNTTN